VEIAIALILMWRRFQKGKAIDAKRMHCKPIFLPLDK
jgi:hypothetical protein